MLYVNYDFTWKKSIFVDKSYVSGSIYHLDVQFSKNVNHFLGICPTYAQYILPRSVTGLGNVQSKGKIYFYLFFAILHNKVFFCENLVYIKNELENKKWPLYFKGKFYLFISRVRVKRDFTYVIFCSFRLPPAPCSLFSKALKWGGGHRHSDVINYNTGPITLHWTWVSQGPVPNPKCWAPAAEAARD